ncbi:MAG: limonene-1,2-epoxide hydrolase family protein [Porticoccaceae bacterium]
MSNTDIVNRFLAALHHNEVGEALNLMTDDIFYHNIPMEPLRGKAAVKDFLERESDLEVLDLVTLHSAENGNIVMNERVDTFRLDGRVLDLPVMGIFELENGKIKAWRDYFDLNTFVSFRGQG